MEPQIVAQKSGAASREESMAVVIFGVLRPGWEDCPHQARPVSKSIGVCFIRGQQEGFKLLRGKSDVFRLSCQAHFESATGRGLFPRGPLPGWCCSDAARSSGESDGTVGAANRTPSLQRSDCDRIEPVGLRLPAALWAF